MTFKLMNIGKARNGDWDLSVKVTRTVYYGFLWLKSREESEIVRLKGGCTVWRRTKDGVRVDPSRLSNFAQQCVFLEENK